MLEILPEHEKPMPPDTVVAMSGGVDSSAAALLLREQGHSVIGVAMQVWDYRNHGGSASRATCCAPADFDDARSVAEQGKFPFYVFDFEASFSQAVIEPFIKSYLVGTTPNPCLECNRKVKFRALRERARALGVKTVATGHYARIRPVAESGELGLFTAFDMEKDQSYFLYALSQDDLRNTLFPVGEMSKDEVRQYLEDKDIRIASKPESQDICFVSGSVADFIERQRPDEIQGGEIINTSGRLVGRHSGVHRYTVGQRKGLGLSNPNPLYVVDIDHSERRIVVGERDELESRGCGLQDVHWIGSGRPENSVEVLVKLRYRHPGLRCQLVFDGAGAEVIFSDEWTAVSPGQAAVFYSMNTEPDGARQVLGGGIIAEKR